MPWPPIRWSQRSVQQRTAKLHRLVADHVFLDQVTCFRQILPLSECSAPGQILAFYGAPSGGLSGRNGLAEELDVACLLARDAVPRNQRGSPREGASHGVAMRGRDLVREHILGSTRTDMGESGPWSNMAALPMNSLRVRSPYFFELPRPSWQKMYSCADRAMPSRNAEIAITVWFSSAARLSRQAPSGPPADATADPRSSQPLLVSPRVQRV